MQFLIYIIECFCPQKLPSQSKNKQENTKTQHPVKQHIPIQSQRKSILPSYSKKQNLPKLKLISDFNNFHYTDKSAVDKLEANENKENQEKTFLSSVVVSQLGGSKLSRNLSIISTQADLLSLKDHYFGSNRSVVQQMVVISSEFQNKSSLKKMKKKYYSLIESKLYVKKDSCFLTKIRSPTSQTSLFCNLQTIRETIHLSEGIPIQNIKILFEETLAYLVQETYQLKIIIKLSCTNCKFLKFMVSSTCKLKLNGACRCGSTQFWIDEVESSPEQVSLWYLGKKLQDGKVCYRTNSQIRAIGCDICWKFQTCSSMSCGCLRCSVCEFQHPNERCMLCL